MSSDNGSAKENTTSSMERIVFPRIDTALKVAQSWLDKIVSGEKTWEIRNVASHFRGWFALFEIGSHQIVGIAHLIDCSSLG